MVVLGVDAHKRTHTVVVADQLGSKLAVKTVAATSDLTFRTSEGPLRPPPFGRLDPADLGIVEFDQ